MASTNYIIDLLKAMGFQLEEGLVNSWLKAYPNHNNYKIRVDVDKEDIDYGPEVTLGDKTTCNFKASENFVVLECVNRLLEKGYKPKSLTLEKDYPLGHKTKGKLDILVADEEGKSYLMIECKTWGAEYLKATKKTLSDGGQLLSYFQQDKAARYLCLYASRIENNSIEYKNGIIKVEPELAEATNTAEVFEKWNKNLKDNGIFEGSSAPYDIVIKALTKSRLNPLTKDDSSRIFNQFAEILRHNVVSDKPNAFNKLITLLLCKIVDEEKSDNEELHFQWLENDNNIDHQKRLNDLYKEGMERYLTKVVTDFSDQDIDNQFYNLGEAQRDEIKRLVTELRLKKNNEFAFKEVFNDASFEENSKVLREVVELLQPYQVRYNKKQQFLGDFFELLLNTSIKQEAGQFFTPVPIARFIINSLPLEKLILDKINKGDSEFLPYVIDYAVGSGHFLTEAMDEIHNIVKKLNKQDNYRPSIKKNLSKWADDYDWAYDFVYGIEKDYRLVKTAKVSCFLNGDGLARIFNADGLGNFKTDEDYKDKLKVPSKADPKDNQQFEVLIANPPYSVSAFKNTLKDGDKSFELYKRLTDEGSEIECLFIERTKQLLKDGGCAGIILPSSILNNAGIYADTREILLKYFRIVAITEFGSNTFMATGTNTVTLFLERRNNTDWQKIQYTVNSFFTNTVDVACNGIDAPFSKYVAHVYKTISLADYVSFINQKPNDTITQHELYKDYRKAFDNATYIKNLQKKTAFKALSETDKQAELDRLFYKEALAREREKLLYFILAYPQKTLLVKANPTGKNEIEKEFLGYEFSNRRGHEGIRPYGARSIQEATKLYDENEPFNPKKVNTYIHKAFLGEEINVPESLENHIANQRLVDMLHFDRVDFIKSISLAVKKKVAIKSKWDIAKLEKVISVLESGNRPKGGVNSYKDGVPSLGGEHINLSGGLNLSNIKYVPESFFNDSTSGTVHKNDILICKDGALTGKVAIVDASFPFEKSMINEHVFLLRVNDLLNQEFLFHFLFSDVGQELLKLSITGQAQGGLNRTNLLNIPVPVPPRDIQKQIVEEIELIEKQEQKSKSEIENYKQVIEGLISGLSGEAESLNSLVEINPSKEIINNLPDNTLVSFIEMASVSNDGHISKVVSKTLKEVKQGYTYFSNGDVLFAKITPCMENGKGAIVSGLPNNIGFGSTEFFVLRPNKISPVLLHQILKSKTFRLEAEKNMTGTSGHRRVPKSFLENYTINLPSLAEQEKIVSEIEKLESQISELEKQLETVSQDKKAILAKYL